MTSSRFFTQTKSAHNPQPARCPETATAAGFRRKRPPGGPCWFAAVAAILAGFTTAPTRGLGAELVFSSPSWAVGAVSLQSTSRRNSAYLPGGSWWNDLAKVSANGYSLAEARSTLRFSGSKSWQRSIELVTFANTGGVYSAASALANTTEYGANMGPSYISVSIRPSRYGESNGKRVRVTVTAWAQSTRSSGLPRPSNTGNFYQVGYGLNNGASLLLNRSDSRGRGTEQRSASFYSKIGSTFRIGMVGYSYATKSSASSALTLRVTMSVQ